MNALTPSIYEWLNLPLGVLPIVIQFLSMFDYNYKVNATLVK